ncbi:hypothetical protein [Embleya sp. NPDC059259]|uniref:hypothetical protein n=1 Tax=unclassified Embleya TaxID=2699296 RepID=UPI00369581F8
MADQARLEDDQNLWRARYTADEGWGPGVAFADHLSVAAPALAVVNGILHCAHRGAREEGRTRLPVRWTSFDPAAAQPFVDALRKASQPLAEGAAEEQHARREKDIRAAAEALEQARKWTPDAVAGEDGGLLSVETPALVDDDGTLRMVFTGSDGDGGRATSLWETHLVVGGSGPTWDPPRRIPVDASLPLAPGLAVFNGAVHLVFVDPDGGSVRHLVRDAAAGTWTPTAASSLPYRETWSDSMNQTELDKHGWPGNVGLAVHDGKLHLAYRNSAFHDVSSTVTGAKGGHLRHAVFDGEKWTHPGDGKLRVSGSKGTKGVPKSRRGAALASHGGRLHAIYPNIHDDDLHHTSWTEDAGWTEPAALKGHPSNNTPALLPFTEGPAGAERDTLLMVHRGIDRHVPPTPPAPPAPPSLADVKERGETVTGRGVVNYGDDAWSRVHHRVSLTPVTLNNDRKGVIATWEATAEYFWGFSWYPENYDGVYRPRISAGTLRFKKAGDRLSALRNEEFSGGFDADGRFRHDVVIPDVEAGEYELYLGALNTRKDGGYWLGSKAALSEGEADSERWTRVHDFSPATVTATV